MRLFHGNHRIFTANCNGLSLRGYTETRKLEYNGLDTRVAQTTHLLYHTNSKPSPLTRDEVQGQNTSERSQCFLLPEGRAGHDVFFMR